MKKSNKMNRILLLIFASIFFISSSINNVSALNNSEIDTYYPHISHYLSSFFQGDETVKVYTNNGDDISNVFLETNYTFYKNNDYESIINNFIELDCFIKVSSSIEGTDYRKKSYIIEPKAGKLITKTTSLYYKILTINGRKTSYEFGACVRASATYNENTGQYTSSRDAYLTELTVTGGDTKAVDFTFNKSISNNNRRIEYNNFVALVTAMVGGQNSGAWYVFDPVQIPYTIIFN